MMADSNSVLRVEGLGVQYGALVALKDVSWTVRAGEILGIIGPNGAGKSTCYDAVTNLVAHDGAVYLGGRDVTATPPHDLAGLGLRRAFQQNAFFDHLSVLDNMVAVAQHEMGSSFAECIFLPFAVASRGRSARKTAAKWLVRMGIQPEFHDRLPGEIPYGTQRMLSIALALGGGAKALMLDEPAAGLGGGDMKALVQLLDSFRSEDLAVVVIEHHMDLIMSVADKIVVLDQGRMLAVGTPSEIQKNEAVLEAYLGRTE